MLEKEDIYNHFKDIGAYKDTVPQKEMILVQNDWFHNNDDAWDEGYFSDDDTANLMSPFGDQKSLAFRRREDIMKLL